MKENVVRKNDKEPRVQIKWQSTYVSQKMETENVVKQSLLFALLGLKFFGSKNKHEKANIKNFPLKKFCKFLRKKV